ncbi:putative Ino eighty subunit 1 [Seiridium cardinale]|uniref:Ino eighty subunit 1 n=1 Tax=Seiridium cardinale TaxID=138064 RepID=A0ABR2X610_9PEZI
MANSEDNGDQNSSRAPSPGLHRSSRNYDSDEAAEMSFNNDNNTTRSSSKQKASRRSHAGATSTVGGAFQTVGKIRHLKKEDGEPLWRKDIQYDFLRSVFDNDRKVFTNSYDPYIEEKQTFADLYIDTMARSSKTSKVLRDKLLSDREAAKSMAMVCLLVNVGRMNTTLNFFPEMRAQLRTYHAIPSLQAYQDASAYKQLQDAPRLKSILKGAAEDREEPRDLNGFKDISVPRTNPVNLIFLVCQQAVQIAELHFAKGGEFHDLIMRTEYTSASRANAFLWVVWQYLESDFTEEGCEENPFGAGVDYGNGLANQGVPKLVLMTSEQEASENIDAPVEVDFGREKQAHRAKIIAADQAYLQEHQSKNRTQRGKVVNEDSPSATILPRIRPSKHDSDMDSARSTPPPRALGRLAASSTGARRHNNPYKLQMIDASSPAGPGGAGYDGVMPRKPRPPTAHQLAVERNRNQRVEYILSRDLRKEHHKARKLRRQEGVIVRTKRRLDAMRDALVDSDEEEYRYADKSNPYRGKGLGGLVPLAVEVDDFGEELATYAASLRRANRRMKRWEDMQDSDVRVVRPVKNPRLQSLHYRDSPGLINGRDSKAASESFRSEAGNSGSNGNANGDVDMQDADDLDEVDKELLGLAGDDEEGDGRDEDDELDDVDKTLLGIDDSDSEEQ